MIALLIFAPCPYQLAEIALFARLDFQNVASVSDQYNNQVRRYEVQAGLAHRDFQNSRTTVELAQSIENLEDIEIDELFNKNDLCYISN